VGDIHFGSKHHMGPQFQDFCDKAHARGVRQFLHVGDLLDGNYRHSVWEQSHRGFEEQVAYAIEHLPRYDGASWHFIQGNHDETLGEHSGLEVGVATVQAFNAAGRRDLHYHGARGAYLRLRAPGEARGMLVELWHPRDKSSAYAKSYRLQKHVEKYAPGQKPDVVAAGHWHQCFFMPVRGVNAFSTGCWQGGQSSFGKSLGGAPDIGSWIVEYSLTPGGTVRTIKPEWVGYHEVETVRDVGLG
jgi:predicted phosphodiesterase